MTKFTIELPRGARTGSLKKAWEASGVDAKWAACGTAKKIAQRATRRNLSDFDRFKVMVAQKKVYICFVSLDHSLNSLFVIEVSHCQGLI